MPIITLLTDFRDVYPAAMKAVILTIAPQTNIVDITHAIPPQNIKWGAAALSFTAPSFPDNTVHVAVVDPGVGSERRSLAIQATGKKTQYLVGPDNGLLIPAAKTIGSFEVFEIFSKSTEKPSPTFHGRVGAKLSLGEDIHEMGVPITDFIELPTKAPAIKNNILTGEIIFIDSFGNIITNIPEEIALNFVNYGETVFLEDRTLPVSFCTTKLCSGETVFLEDRTLPFVHTYADVNPGEPLLLIGSHGFLEISLNKSSAKDYFNIDTEDIIQIIK